MPLPSNSKLLFYSVINNVGLAEQHHYRALMNATRKKCTYMRRLTKLFEGLMQRL